MLKPLPRPTLRSEIVSHIAEAIITGKFVSGSRLQERELSTQLGISRTPLREALLELDFLGLITLNYYRGAIINNFDAKDLADVYNIRALLEAEAARLACGHLDPKVIDTLLAKMAEHLNKLAQGANWAGASAKLDEDFHQAIWRQCDSLRLQKELEHYRGIIATIRKCLGSKYQMQARSIEEHIAILVALKARKPELASDLMRTHVQNAGKNAAAVMFSQ